MPKQERRKVEIDVTQENLGAQIAKTETRNHGIDILRVIATIIIIMFHILSQGGILKSWNGTVGGEALWFFQVICFCGVNLFALISGYVGLSAKHKTQGILSLWLQVCFYSVLSVLLVSLFRFDSFSVTSLLKAFVPVITSENWYFTAYFALFFLMPVLNELIEKADRATLKKTFFAAVVIFMIMETINSVAEFGVRVGYSVLWLALLYLIGAYIKKYNPLSSFSSKKCVIGFFACVILTFLSKLLILLVTWWLTGTASHSTKFITYTSPLMVLQAVFLLQLFSQMSVPHKLSRVVSFFVPMTFGVYIIHTTGFVYRHLLIDAFSFVNEYPFILTIGISVLATLSIFLICSLIDWLRILLFKLLRINKAVKFLGGKIDKTIDRLLIKSKEKI